MVSWWHPTAIGQAKPLPSARPGALSVFRQSRPTASCSQGRGMLGFRGESFGNPSCQVLYLQKRRWPREGTWSPPRDTQLKDGLRLAQKALQGLPGHAAPPTRDAVLETLGCSCIIIRNWADREGPSAGPSQERKAGRSNSLCTQWRAGPYSQLS